MVVDGDLGGIVLMIDETEIYSSENLGVEIVVDKFVGKRRS